MSLMKANFLQPNTASNRIFAGLLAFWMSGAIFLLCCGAVKVPAAETETCPLSHKGHCSKTIKDENVPLANQLEADNPAIECCGFLSGFFDKLKTAKEAQSIAEITVRAEIKIPLRAAFVRAWPVRFPGYRPLVLNRGDAYLRNCVFRI